MTETPITILPVPRRDRRAESRRRSGRRLAILLLFLAGMFLGLARSTFESAQAAEEPDIRWLHSAGPPESSVDIAFVGDGYTREQEEDFWKDVDRYSRRLLAERPFCWYESRFNVAGAFVASAAAGCDLSPTAGMVDTLLDCHFDSPSGRLLVFRNRARLREIVDAVEHVEIAFVMVNVKKYGGSGSVHLVRGRPLPTPTFSAMDTDSFMIAVHELGHSFAHLADEYDDAESAPRYPLPRHGDLAAANATLSGQFDPSSFDTLRQTLKWKHFLDLPGAADFAWVHRGAYYRSKGVFRPWRTCMMNTLGDPFCPVCAEQLAKAIVATCGDTWESAQYHQQAPLSLWK